MFQLFDSLKNSTRIRVTALRVAPVKTSQHVVEMRGMCVVINMDDHNFKVSIAEVLAKSVEDNGKDELNVVFNFARGFKYLVRVSEASFNYTVSILVSKQPLISLIILFFYRKKTQTMKL